MIQVLTDILSDTQLADLKRGYGNGSELLGVFNAFLSMHIPSTERFSAAIGEQFYVDDNDQRPNTPSFVQMSPAVRERCLIAVLTARAPDGNLGLHIYMGLMNDLTVAEIGEIIFLAGVYSGVDHLTGAMKVAAATLQALQAMTEFGALAVMQAIEAAVASIGIETRFKKIEER